MESPKKLLILSFSGVGAGHIRVGQTLSQTAKEKFPEVETLHADMVDYITLPMKKTVIDSYALMAKRLPELWGFLYDTTDNPKIAPTFTKLTKQLKRMNSHRLYEFITDFRPDAVLCTHFLPADAILNAPKRELERAPPVSVILTDYDIHTLWIVHGIHRYFVATDKMKWKIIRKGVAADRVMTSGIPVDPVFFEAKDARALKKKYSLPEDQKIILALSGGHGMGKSDKIAETIFGITRPATIIVIAGKNGKLTDALEHLTPPPHITLRTVGWTDTIDEYMRMADVIVTKSGGLTTTECMTLGKPMVIVDPIPGQEDRNAEFALEQGFGRVARGPDDLLYWIEHDIPAIAPMGQKKNAAESILEKLIADF